MRKTGVTTETVKHLVLDSGVIFLDYGKQTQKVLGACRGGNEFNVEREWRDMPFDGVGGLVKGARRLISVTASMTVNLVELSKELLVLATPGAKFEAATGTEAGLAVNSETYYKIKSIMEDTIPDLKFSDISIVAEYSHHKSPIVCTIKNAMANSNLQLSFNDADESVLSITFTGAFDPAEMAVEPWVILIPEKLETV